jgi:hypothetical protein
MPTGFTLQGALKLLNEARPKPERGGGYGGNRYGNGGSRRNNRW